MAELIFDEAAEDYDAARPGYPPSLVNALIALSGIPAGERILEIGAGTGQLTRPLAERGWAVTALEPGQRLAAIARQHLASFATSREVETSFEEWNPGGDRFGLVASATALHHVEAAVRYSKPAAVLVTGGALGLCANYPGADDSGWREEVDRAYARYAPSLAGGVSPTEDRINETVRAIDDSGFFGGVEVRRYPWSVEYDAVRYGRLLRTYSGHRRLPPADLAALTGEISHLIAGRGGVVTHALTAVLFVARRP